MVYFRADLATVIVEDLNCDELSSLLTGLSGNELDLKTDLTLNLIASTLSDVDFSNKEEEKQACSNSRIPVWREFLGDIKSSQHKVLEAQIKPDISTEKVLKASFTSDSFRLLEKFHQIFEYFRMTKRQLRLDLGLSFRGWFKHGVNPAEIFITS